MSAILEEMLESTKLFLWCCPDVLLLVESAGKVSSLRAEVNAVFTFAVFFFLRVVLGRGLGLLDVLLGLAGQPSSSSGQS